MSKKQKFFRYYSSQGGETPEELILRLISETSGAWWDTNDISTLFQNTAGTTPVTAAGQTVKCIKDKSGNGWHLTNSVGDLYQVDEGGVGYVAFSGSTGQLWATTSSTAAFKYLHDGTGGSLITVLEKSVDALAAKLFIRTGTGAGTGFEFNVNGAGLPQMTVRNAGATVVSQVNPLANPYGPGARRIHAYSLDGSNLKQYCDGETAYRTTALTGSPNTGNSTRSFEIGNTIIGKFLGGITIGKVLTDSEWETISGYLEETHGRPVPEWNTIIGEGGQSNKEGSNSMSASAEAANVNIAMYDKSDKIRVANEPTHDRTNWIATTLTGGGGTSHGSGLKFAKEIYTASSGSVKPILVPGAVGGTSMANWMPTANRLDRLTLYGSMNARIQALLAMNPSADVVLNWFGHEAATGLVSENLATGAFGTDYMSSFFNLMAEWREDYPDAPLFYAQISVDNTASATVRMAQESLRRCELSYGGDYAVPNSYMIVSHDLKRNASPDGVHLSEEAQIEIGRRFSLAYRAIVLGEVINWQGPRLVSVTKPGAATVLVKFSRTINNNLNNFGTLFRVYSDGVEHTVSSAVRDTDDTAVLLTLSANHSGVVVVTYGERNTSNNVARADVVIDSDSLPAPVFGPYVAT
jgi:hypothetical protein